MKNVVKARRLCRRVTVVFPLDLIFSCNLRVIRCRSDGLGGILLSIGWWKVHKQVTVTLMRPWYSNSSFVIQYSVRVLGAFAYFTHPQPYLCLDDMPPKRPKRSPAASKGLAPGESLKRYLVPAKSPQSSLWNWVGSEVSQVADITPEHYLTAYGLSARNMNAFCINKYAISQAQPPPTPPEEKDRTAKEDDVIVISDDEQDKCTKKSCKDNPNCLNYLGQEKWEDEGMQSCV